MIFHLLPLFIYIVSDSYCSEGAEPGQCTSACGTTSHWQQDTCGNSHPPDDFSSPIIQNIYSSMKQAESQLANPADFPPHYSPQEGEEFDFIVVGSGSAGSVISNRLSEISTWKILLLEAGGNPTLTSEIPALYGTLQKTSVDWQYQTDPDEDNCLGMVNNSCNWPRGKILGGSSSINGNLYVRANPRDYDAWAAAGNTGWDYKSVLPYFKKSEDIKAEEVLNNPNYRAHHGEKGYLSVDTWRSHGIKDLVGAFSKGMEELGYKTNMDCNGETQSGFVKLQGTIIDGKRCSAAKAFLKPIKNRTNLKVSKHSLVTKLLIDKKTMTAYGVEFLDGHGKVIKVKTKKEVIVSAGAINSPQLLMLSGIGPKQQLEKLKIKVIKDLPVGENLQDHQLMVGHVFSHNYTRPVKPFNDYFYYFLMSNSSKLSDVGMLGYSAFINTVDNSIDYPDMQIHYYDYNVNDTFILASTLASFGIKEDIGQLYHELNSKRFITLIMLTLLRPESRGRILLKSTNPMDKPKIISGYFSDDGRDLETYLRAIDFISKLASTEGMKKLDTTFHEIAPPVCKNYPESSNDFRKCTLKHLATTCYHPTSTCKMGPDDDPSSVVNPSLQVRGVKHLRVADASIMPNIVAGNTNAPTIMIGERASDLIKDSWQ